MRLSTHVAIGAAVILASGLTARPAHSQGSVKSELPDSLSTLAKVDESAARATAARQVPNGRIRAVELERERGHLQYSYDVEVPGNSGITEVNVDAITGKVLGKHHESATDEAKEGAKEHKPNSQ
jgi:Peptidase propeptide and YPEB domain